MEPIKLSCSLREGRGKGPNRRLRMDEQLPAVVYGHGLDNSVAVTLNPRELAKGLENPKGYNTLFALDVNGKTVQGLIRQVQRKPSTRQIQHVDVVVPDPDNAMVADVPVTTSGRAVGVLSGGKLIQNFRTVKVACRPADIPAIIDIDVTNLNHNQSVMASGLPLPEGVKPVFDHDYVVVKVLGPHGSEAPQK